MYKEEWPDPELVAKDLTEVMGSDALPARLFNASSVLAHVAADDAASMLVVRMVNYATAASGLLTVRVNRPYRAAWLFRPGVPPAELEVRRSGQRTEVQFKDIAVSAAVVFRK